MWIYVFLCFVTLHCWGLLLVFFLGTGMPGPISISTALFVHKWCCSFQVFGPFDDRNQGNSSNRTGCCYLLLFPCSIWLCDCTLWLFKYNAYAFLLFWFWFLCCLTSFSLFCFVLFCFGGFLFSFKMYFFQGYLNIINYILKEFK